MNTQQRNAARITWIHCLALLSVAAIAWLCLVMASPLSAQDEPAANDAAAYSDEGVQSCITCHGADDELPAHQILATPHGVMSDPNSPFGEGAHDCETCHGPSKAHLSRNEDGSRPPVDFAFDSSTDAKQQNSVCLGCHEDASRFHWPGSTHDIEAVACVNCHDIHAVDDPVLALETQPKVCFECHQEQRAQFLRQSRHPVQASTNEFAHTGMLACTDCHNPHGGSGPALLARNTVNESCYDCHAEKRGPVLWEHAPVREDCTNCHTPHGSNYENLLTARQPWLCQQCHAAAFHPSGVYSGSGIPPAGADQRVLGKQCLNCHSQIHGSNHPSGIRLTR
ncbi:MAG TPA: DmsE family decaheme c-type cytochrome [Xanthomonadales bacterium]|nr:DmsE family decaheme c-type cytochrome [Xanthomonadales bacterium]